MFARFCAARRFVYAFYNLYQRGTNLAVTAI
jgi:hypothetical protein